MQSGFLLRILLFSLIIIYLALQKRVQRHRSVILTPRPYLKKRGNV